ncbi:hypothetical protein KBD20_01550, partial [Candidatus Saccharibacteria bacterium]|nr:hypothetical protein [Candidatus Saccharibacteria bacterium]
LTLLGIIIAPTIFWVGGKMSIAEQLTYKEFYNGVETAALEHVTTCSEGYDGDSEASGRSNCTYVYVCGSYTYETTESRQVYAGSDSKGNPQYRTEYYQQSHSADIECPYLTKEYQYEILDSLPGGSHDLPGVYGASQPVAWGERGIPRDIPLGPPAEWTASKQRLDAGDPRPVTRMFEYDNYILAAQEDMLLPYSEDIEAYREDGILPDHTQNILEDPTYGPLDSLANKLSFVGVEPPVGEEKWQESLNGLNAALGMSLRGDVHMVIIDAKLVTSKVKYVNALKAHWLGERFGRKAIAKNSVIIVVGVTGNKVQWAEASTGMPYGNEVMLEAISTRFQGTEVPFTPEKVIGNPRMQMKGVGDNAEPKLTLAETPGVIEGVILRDFPFLRASMECEDKDDGESCLGFSHLVSKLQPSTGAKLTMGSIVFLISLVLWGLAYYFEWFGWLANRSGQEDRHRQRVHDRRYRYRTW